VANGQATPSTSSTVLYVVVSEDTSDGTSMRCHGRWCSTFPTSRLCGWLCSPAALLVLFLVFTLFSCRRPVDEWNEEQWTLGRLGRLGGEVLVRGYSPARESAMAPRIAVFAPALSMTIR
jgi:hypothetical protein